VCAADRYRWSRARHRSSNPPMFVAPLCRHRRASRMSHTPRFRAQYIGHLVTHRLSLVPWLLELRDRTDFLAATTLPASYFRTCDAPYTKVSRCAHDTCTSLSQLSYLRYPARLLARSLWWKLHIRIVSIHSFRSTSQNVSFSSSLILEFKL